MCEYVLNLDLFPVYNEHFYMTQENDLS